ncbi:MAG: methionyl-tRNA formyltransferase [Alphaproteobacteria bacterium]|nr:methionyl-tRNA formyltransferase [Alphaproteobacteria bacterium]
MARVDRLERKQMERNSLHEPATASYTVFGLDGGKKVLQIDSYGSDQRQAPGKKSQSLQFTEETAAELMRILRDEMGLR